MVLDDGASAALDGQDACDFENNVCRRSVLLSIANAMS